MGIATGDYNRDGKVDFCVTVFSDDDRLIGATSPLGSRDVTALRENRVRTEVSHSSNPESRFTRSDGKQA